MQPANLATDPNIDLAAVDLDYERFRELAQNPHLSAHGKIGFIDSQRVGYEDAIYRDILAKLPMLANSRNQVIVDVGPGCADLPRRLIELCQKQGHRLILVDSPEMLKQLPDVAGVTEKLPGKFPDNLAAIMAQTGPKGADAFLCYSVLHYLYVDSNLFDVVDATVQLLGAGGRALYGDIPNQSKRMRFFASETGIAFHQAYMKTTDKPVVNYNRPYPGKIDDAVLAGMIGRAQAGGCDAYLLPQDSALPMANRRDDLLFSKP
jgi:hypothetical protein